jgi:zinc protease
MKALIVSTVIAAVLSMLPGKAHSIEIRTVTSQGGITAWLAEDQSSSIVSLRFAFLSGSADDPPGKSGTANVLAKAMSDGGRGGQADTFKAKLVRWQARLSFEAERDTIQGRIDTVAQSLDDVTGLAAEIILGDQLDPAVVTAATERAARDARQAAQDTSALAEDTWMAAAFAGHGYARPTSGDFNAIPTIGSRDLSEFAERAFTKSRLVVAAAGHIDTLTLAAVLDRMFAALPSGSLPKQVPQLKAPAASRTLTVPVPAPDVVLHFGASAPMRSDSDFTAAVVMNEILGGAPFGSRLTRALRDAAGIAYSVNSRITTDRYSSVLTGEAGIGPGDSERAISIVRGQVERLAQEGPTREELDNAKARLIGSYGFGFDSTKRIADTLLALQLDRLPPDSLSTRQAAIDSVTADAIKAVTRKITGEGKLWFVVAGGLLTKSQSGKPNSITQR